MKNNVLILQERVLLLATNTMRAAGIQGVYGDPCGIDFVPVTYEEALARNLDEILLVDAGSMERLFETLSRFRERNPGARILVIGTDQDETYVECVIAAGAKGFLGANATKEEFRHALLNIREGSIWATRKVLSRLAESQMLGRAQTQAAMPVRFTPREREIITLLLRGRANREIGESLGIGPETVKAHLARIMRKTGVANRIELTVYAIKHSPPASSSKRQRGSPQLSL